MLQRLTSNKDLALTSGAAILAALLTMLAPYPPFSLLAPLGAIALIAWLPGYALTALLFPGPELGSTERRALSVGLSFALTVLIGLALHLSSIGLRREAWQLSLPAITLLCAGLAAYRRPHAPAPTVQRLHVGLGSWIAIGGIVLMMFSALQLARTPTPTQGLSGYTALWIVPTETTEPTIQLGVLSNEFEEVGYILRLETATSRLGEWKEIRLQPGEQWEISIPLDAQTLGSNPVYGRLYRSDAPAQLYREIIWWPEKPARET